MPDLQRPSLPRARRRPARQERGIVLLLVLGILTLLSLLAVSFVFQSRSELRTAQNFEGTVTASEVATAGFESGVRLLELDQTRRMLGPDFAPDTGDEEPYDAPIDIWRAGLTAPVRVTYTGDVNEAGGLTTGMLIQSVSAGDVIDPPLGTVLDTGRLLGFDPTGVGGLLYIATQNPSAWDPTTRAVNAPTILGPGTAVTQFGAGAGVTVATLQVASNDRDLNADAVIQQANLVDDDGDGATDEADEGLDAVWHNYYDRTGRLVGRYSVLVEDENAKVNVNAAHNLADEPAATAADNVPTDNIFGQNEGTAPTEINLQEAADEATAATVAKLVQYRFGLPQAAGSAPPAYNAAGAETNRLYVGGQGFVDSPAYSVLDNDDDDASRRRLENWYDFRTRLGADGTDNDADGCIDEFGETGDTTFPGGTINIVRGDGIDNDADSCIDESDEGPFGPDGIDNNTNGCVDEFGEVGDTTFRQVGGTIDLMFGDGVDNDGDGCIDERDEGVNEPQEFNILAPVHRQPQAGADFEDDGVDNDGDPPAADLVDETHEGDDQPIYALEDLVDAEEVNMGAAWLTDPVTYANTVNAMTARRNLLTTASQTRNLDQFEAPRWNPNYLNTAQAAAAVLSHSPLSALDDGFYSFREVEFNALQAAANLHDYRDRDHKRHEVQDGAGNVFAGVEAVRINEVMVTPRTDIFDAEGDYNANATADLTEAHALAAPFAAGPNFPNGTWVAAATATGEGRPRPTGLVVEGYITNVAADSLTTAWEYSGTIAFTMPAAGVGAYFTSIPPTDNDGDAATGEDPAVDVDADGFANEDWLNGIDDDGDGLGATDNDDPPVDDDGDTRFNEDGGFSVAVPNAGDTDYVFKLVMRVRTNANFGFGAGLAAPDRGFMVFVNNEAVYPGPGGAAAPVRWGIPAPLTAAEDGLWRVQQGICHLVPGVNTIRFLKPAPAAAGVTDNIDIDWFYFTLEPDCQWIELVNLGLEPVDVSNWTIDVDSLEDTDLTSFTTRQKPLTTQLTIPVGTVLAPPDATGVVQHTVLVVDAAGGNALGTTGRSNTILDNEAGDGNAADAIAFDRYWATPVAPHQLVELDGIGSIAATPPLPAVTLVSGTADVIPFTSLFPREPLDDPNTPNPATEPNSDTANDALADEDPIDGINNDPGNDALVDEDWGPRQTWTTEEAGIIAWTDPADGLDKGVYVARIALKDANGNLVDRVTYDGTQWSDNAFLTGGDGVAGLKGTLRGMRSLERLNPVWAGETLIQEYAGSLDTDAQGVTLDPTVDNFYLIAYSGADMIGAPARVKADGNYDNWFPTDLYTRFTVSAAFAPTLVGGVGAVNVSPNVDATPGAPNDPDGDAAANYWSAARVKNHYLANVGELGNVPFPSSATMLTAAGIEALYDDVPPVTQVDDTLRLDETANPPLAEVATLRYAHVPNETTPSGNFTTRNPLRVVNTTQGSNERILLGIDTVNDTLHVFDDGNASPWQIGDTITIAGAPVFTTTITGIYTPEPVDVASLADAFTVDALALEPARAAVTAVTWANAAAATDPAEYTIAINNIGAGDQLDLVWDEDDGIEPGRYNLYIQGQARARLNVSLLDEAGNVVAGTLQPLLEAELGDNLVVYDDSVGGTIQIPPPGDTTDDDGVDNDGDGRVDELELRLRITNGGADVGTGVVQNRVTRVILTPPERTLGRININTASARVLRGLPNLQRLTKASDGVTDVTIAERIVEDRQMNGPFTSIGDLMSATRGLNSTAASGLLGDGHDNDGDAPGPCPDPLCDEASEAEDVFRPISNLITVRSDLFKLIVLGQAAVDANADGIVQDAEVRAEKKLEFIYER